ncbi:hypothetical protein [Thermicanus aegyptius]|uniref:hypothetical protein n=1 Tax=Thermicanus aegyptius TaxID=94009 RepID=UPI00041D0F58|nr:hypothetical protein [Thermicanus aegyptius]
MKIPNFRTHPERIRNLLLFFFGICVGILWMLLYTGGELNRLYLEVKKLRFEKLDLEEKNKRIEEELTRWNHEGKVHDVVIHFEGSSVSEGIKDEIERRIVTQTRYLIGKKLDSLEETYESLFQVFSPKIYMIDQKPYKVTLKSLVIGKKVHLYLMLARTM